MTPEEVRQDGIRSYDLAVKEARRRMLEPTEAKLWIAIKILRENGVRVWHVEGEGICALWNVGPLNKVGYFEVIRAADRLWNPSRATRKIVNARAWPDMPKDAFR